MGSKLLAAIVLLAGTAFAVTATVDTAMAAGAGSHYAVTGQIDAPEGAWTFASIDPAKRRLYVGRSDGILTVDLEAQKATALTQGGRRVQMIVPVPGNDLVVGTKDQTNTAVLLDGSTGAVLGEIATGRRPETAAFDPATGLVAVMAGSAEVTLIDPNSKSAVGSIPVAGILESAVADGQGRLYINLEDKNSIAVVDLRGRKMVGTYALPGCEEPTGLGYDPKTNLLLSACSNKVAKAIDAATGADRATISIGGGPDAVIVDSERRMAFIPCSEGHLAAISLAGEKPRLIESVVTAQGTNTGALDPRTGRVYLPVGRSAATAFGGRAVPGFAVLVVTRK